MSGMSTASNDDHTFARTPVKKYFPGEGWLTGSVVSSMIRPSQNGKGKTYSSLTSSNSSSSSVEYTDVSEARYQVRYSNDFTEDYPHYVLVELIALALVEIGSHVVLYSYEVDRYFHAVVREVDDSKTNNIHAAFETTRTDWIDLRRFKFQLISSSTEENTNTGPHIPDSALSSYLIYPLLQHKKKDMVDQSTQTKERKQIHQSTQTRPERPKENRSTQTVMETKDQYIQTVYENKDSSTQTNIQTNHQSTQTILPQQGTMSTQTNHEDFLETRATQTKSIKVNHRGSQTPADEKCNQEVQTAVQDFQQTQSTQTEVEVKCNQAVQTTGEAGSHQATQTPIEIKFDQGVQTTGEAGSHQATQTPVEVKSDRGVQTTGKAGSHQATQTPVEIKSDQGVQTTGEAGSHQATQTTVEGKCDQAVQTMAQEHQRNQCSQTLSRPQKTRFTQTTAKTTNSQAMQTDTDRKRHQQTQTLQEAEAQTTQTPKTSQERKGVQAGPGNYSPRHESKQTVKDVNHDENRKTQGENTPTQETIEENQKFPDQSHPIRRKRGRPSKNNPAAQTHVNATDTPDHLADLEETAALLVDSGGIEEPRKTELPKNTDVLLFEAVGRQGAPRKVENSSNENGSGNPVLVLNTPALSSVNKNDHLAILWDQNEEYYEVKVLEVRRLKNRTVLHHLEYTHDGYREWTLLAKREFFRFEDFVAYESYLESQRDGSIAAENIKKVKQEEEERRSLGRNKHNLVREPFVRIELPDDKTRCIDLQTALRRTVKAVRKGCRVAVWWPAEKQFYKGTVESERTKKGMFQHQVIYDDGEKAWLSFEAQFFILLLPPDQANAGDNDIVAATEMKPAAITESHKMNEKEEDNVGSSNAESGDESFPGPERPDLSSVVIGSVVELHVTWSRRFRRGVVTDIDQSEKQYLVEFDHFHREWVSLENVEYRIVEHSPVAKKQGSGAVTTKAKRGRGRPRKSNEAFAAEQTENALQESGGRGRKRESEASGKDSKRKRR